MNTEEIKALSSQWEALRQKYAHASQAEDITLSDTCYVVLGTVGMSVWKYRLNKWQRKIVNRWKTLSFSEFLFEYRKAEWEDLKP